MIYRITLLIAWGLIPLGSFDALAQYSAAPARTAAQDAEQTFDRGTRVLTPAGEVALGAKVFVGIGETMTLIGKASEIRGLGHPVNGQKNAKGRVRRDVFLRSLKSDGLDLANIRQEIDGRSEMEEGMGMEDDMGMSGMGMSGMGSGGPGLLSAFYYVTHPEHGFAFVPFRREPPSVIRLRPPATLKVHVPKRYSPDEFVVLACWMNRYADPVSFRRIQSDDEMMYDMGHMGGGMDDMGGGMGGGMGGMGGGMGGMGGMGDNATVDPTFVTDPLRSRFSDTRLRTMVTHWTVSPLVVDQEHEFANVATVVLPPGEVRVTLVPKAVVNRHLDNAQELERLLFFGGPSQVKLVASDIKGHLPLMTILPHRAVSDIEFVGRPGGSGIPNWSERENSVFLTPFQETPPQSVSVPSDRVAIRIAEGDRHRRSEAFLGRIAHRVGKERYFAIGIPKGQHYYVWSADANELLGMTTSVKSCDFRQQSHSLQPMSVAAVASADASRWDKTHPATILVPSSRDAGFQRMYRLILSNPQFDERPRRLIDMKKRIVFKAVDPNLDPFTAKVLPNTDVGVIAEKDLPSVHGDMMDMGGMMGEMDMDMDMDMDMGMDMESSRGDMQKRLSEASPTANKSDTERIDILRLRIQKLDKDLQRAKKILADITNQ